MAWKSVCAAMTLAAAAGGVEIPFDEQPVGMNEDEVKNVVAIDFDFDGDIDVLSGSEVLDRIVLFESDGGVSPTFTRVNLITGISGLVSFDVADLDGDGDLDVAAAASSADMVLWYEQAPSGMKGMPPTFTPHPLATVDLLTRVRIADVDSDGDPDILYAGLSAFAWLDSDGGVDPVFTDRAIPTSSTLPQDLRVVDLNGDGDKDIALCSTLGVAPLLWYESDGGAPPTFSEHEIETVLTTPRSLVVADINRDLAPDLAVASDASAAVAWYESSGGAAPEFSEHLISETLSAATRLDASDLDSNGFIDLVVTSAGDDKVMWYDSDGALTPTFTERPITGLLVSSPREVMAADIDGDSDPDVLVASAGVDQVIYFRNELAPVRNLTRGTVHQSVVEALGAAVNDDEITAAAFLFESEGALDFNGVGATLRSSGAIDQPVDGVYTLADRARLAATPPDGVSLLGEAHVPLGARAELGGLDVQLGVDASLLIDPGATLVFDSGAGIANAGLLDVLGGSLLSDGAFTSSGEIAVVQGVLSADELTNDGMFSGSADIFADVVNTGSFTVGADSLIAGALTNDGTVTVQSGVLTILGTLTNNGEIVGETGSRGGAGDGLFVDGSLTLGAGASLALPADGVVSVAGDVDSAINDAARFDLSQSELRLAGLGGTQFVEAMSEDIGVDPAGLTRGPGRFPIGSLTVGLTPAVVELVDVHENAAAPGAEAVYTRTLRIASGAELRTNGVRVYYEVLQLLGSVDEPSNLIALGTACPADIIADGVVDAFDLAALLAQWGGSGDADLTGDGVVDAFDLAVVLAGWGACP